jgi:hypothetical protein
MMKAIIEEIKDSIENRENEWPIHMLLKYAPDKVTVIWADNALTRETFTIEWTTVGGQFSPEYDVECVHIDGEPCEFSLEIEQDRIESAAELW